jgi:hypothetical protein
MIVIWHTIWPCWTKLERLLTIIYHHMRALEICNVVPCPPMALTPQYVAAVRIMQFAYTIEETTHIWKLGFPLSSTSIMQFAYATEEMTHIWNLEFPLSSPSIIALCTCYRGDDSHLKIRVPSQQSKHHAVCICYRGDDSHLKNRVPSRQLLNPERGYYWLLLLAIPQPLPSM